MSLPWLGRQQRANKGRNDCQIQWDSFLFMLTSRFFRLLIYPVEHAVFLLQWSQWKLICKWCESCMLLMIYLCFFKQMHIKTQLRWFCCSTLWVQRCQQRAPSILELLALHKRGKSRWTEGPSASTCAQLPHLKSEWQFLIQATGQTGQKSYTGIFLPN